MILRAMLLPEYSAKARQACVASTSAAASIAKSQPAQINNGLTTQSNRREPVQRRWEGREELGFKVNSSPGNCYKAGPG